MDNDMALKIYEGRSAYDLQAYRRRFLIFNFALFHGISFVFTTIQAELLRISQLISDVKS